MACTNIYGTRVLYLGSLPLPVTRFFCTENVVLISQKKVLLTLTNMKIKFL